MSWRKAILLLCVGLALGGQGRTLHADGKGEAEVKAALVVNFLLFAEWPGNSSSQPDKPLLLCTLDGAEFAASFSDFRGTSIQGMPLVPLRLDGALSDIRRCHAVFVASENPYALAQVVAATRGLPILIIAQGGRSLQGGAMIALSLAGGRFVFDINLATVRAAGLFLSSKLLRLARSVEE